MGQAVSGGNKWKRTTNDTPFREATLEPGAWNVSAASLEKTTCHLHEDGTKATALISYWVSPPDKGINHEQVVCLFVCLFVVRKVTQQVCEAGGMRTLSLTADHADF